MLSYLKELYRKRELIGYLVTADISEEHHNKFFGIAWSLLDPIIMMGIYYFLVVVIFKRGTPQYPVLLFSALLAWRWFTTALVTSLTSVAVNEKIIKSVKFPIAVFPVSRVIGGFVDYMCGMLVLMPLLVVFRADINMNVLWFIPLLLTQFIFITGLCLIISFLGVYFRDIRNLIQYIIRIFFFISPILYSVADRVPEGIRPLYMMNPFSALFVSYKNVLVGGKAPDPYMLYTCLVAAVAFFLGLYIFTKHEGRFAKDI